MNKQTLPVGWKWSVIYWRSRNICVVSIGCLRLMDPNSCPSKSISADRQVRETPRDSSTSCGRWYNHKRTLGERKSLGLALTTKQHTQPQWLGQINLTPTAFPTTTPALKTCTWKLGPDPTPASPRSSGVQRHGPRKPENVHRTVSWTVSWTSAIID